MCRAICTHGSLRGYRREMCPISSGNFLMPLMVGGPDMASSTPLEQRDIELGSYLAGLFEADGFIGCHD